MTNEEDKPIIIRCRQNGRNDFTVLGEQMFKALKVTRVNDIVTLQGLGFYPAAHLKKLASLYKNAVWEMVYDWDSNLLRITIEDEGIKVKFNLKVPFEKMLKGKGKSFTFDLVDPHKATETAVEPATVPVKPKRTRKLRQPKPMPVPKPVGHWERLRGWLGNLLGENQGIPVPRL